MRGESEASQEDYCPDQRRHSHSCSTEQLDCSWKRDIRTLMAHDQHKDKLCTLECTICTFHDDACVDPSDAQYMANGLQDIGDE